MSDHRMVISLWGLLIPYDGKRNPIVAKARLVSAPFGALTRAKKENQVHIFPSGEQGRELAQEALANLAEGFSPPNCGRFFA